MVLRIQTVYQNLFLILVSKRPYLIWQTPDLLITAYIHIPQPAVEKVSQRPFQAAQLQFCTALLLSAALNQFSWHILFQRLCKQSGFAGLTGQLDHLIILKLPPFKLLFQKACHQTLNIRPQYFLHFI